MKEFKINNARLQFLEEKGKFPLECSNRVLSGKARELVENFGYLFKALIDWTERPIDVAEEEFVEEIRQNRPTTDCAKAWLRYKNKETVESSIAVNQSPKLIENSILTREGSAKIKDMLHSDRKDRNRKL